ncbi:MAG: hypothetical protein LBK71_11365 [Verrucomicrobiales bacterium]|nr:hypothetical protein [Verrucomicrobiales bacterium]
MAFGFWVWGLGLAAAMPRSAPAAAENFADAAVFKRLTAPAAAAVPVVKNLDRAWVARLAERGEPTIYTRENSNHFAYLGMPVGGIGAGQLYLSGDGRLWWWDIFNTALPAHKFSMEQGEVYRTSPGPDHGTGRGRTAAPAQGFAISVVDGGQTSHRPLSAAGFADVKFRGQYPVGTVDFADPAVPLTVRLAAFSPFIPTNAADSTLPVTIFRYAVTNTSSRPLAVTISGSLENAALRSVGDRPAGLLENLTVSGGGAKMLLCRVAPELLRQRADRSRDITIEDWQAPDFRGWTVSGTGFGDGPVNKDDLPHGMSDVGGDAPRVVNTYIHGGDGATGALRRDGVLLSRDYLALWVAGGTDATKTYAALTVDGREVRRAASPRQDNWLARVVWDVREFRDRRATLTLADGSGDSWAQLSVGRIWLTDTPAPPLDQAPDCGSLALAAIGDPATVSVSGTLPAAAARGPVGAVARTLTVPAGETKNFDFALAWYFPNLQSNYQVPGVRWQRRTYGWRFADAAAVAEYVAEHFTRLSADTLAWRDTWYDSSLPWWFLDRTMASASNLAAGVTFLLGREGVYYANEGVDSCPGTCAHVYQYAHTLGRLFPALERRRRELVDLGFTFDADGVIATRGEVFGGFSADGQAGTLLRIYREHLLSKDNSFLTRHWANIKLAYEPLFKLDADGDGILEGAQPNTLDEPWHGKIAWLSGLYVAALRAGERMALTVGDAEFAKQCATIAAAGEHHIVSELYNGEYFINLPDPEKPDGATSGGGCQIDQVYGQAWAWQVGLGRVLPEQETRSALRAVFRHNFTTDVAPYRAKFTKGRVFAMHGEGGVLLGTWPDPAWPAERARGVYLSYLNEVWTGNEHALAAHLLWEGLAPEALTVERAMHERYDGMKRNPWSEVECGAHYGRALAAYGVFLAACGFHLDGPAGTIEFAPRLSADNFRAAFTAPEGWGSYWQKQAADGGLAAGVELRYGTLTVQALTLTAGGDSTGDLALNGKPVPARFTVSGEKITLTFDPLTMQAGDTLTVTAR